MQVNHVFMYELTLDRHVLVASKKIIILIKTK